MVEFIERIGGVYDALTGETPKGVTAATAIQLLQEQGSIPVKGIARNLYQALKNVYELMIELVKETTLKPATSALSEKTERCNLLSLTRRNTRKLISM